jgi:hypothetical protein
MFLKSNHSQPYWIESILHDHPLSRAALHRATHRCRAWASGHCLDPSLSTAPHVVPPDPPPSPFHYATQPPPPSFAAATNRVARRRAANLPPHPTPFETKSSNVRSSFPATSCPASTAIVPPTRWSSGSRRRYLHSPVNTTLRPRFLQLLGTPPLFSLC